MMLWVRLQTFKYLRAKGAREAIEAAAQSSTAEERATIRFVAGGTTLLDLMKLDVETPTLLIDINGLST